ncbi:MAG: zinc ribbon domain-containing protein [Acidobacteria bacterium]|nr:zinc ribbon domain-containing protein [Acidobacteriota bacterium]MBS1865460.1 zinc ribbon domain-containing protein [Acidobacteriota bacterium]
MGTPGPSIGQSFGDSWNERMRLIRLRRKKEAFRFSDEFRIIPKWLKVLCLVLYVIAIAIGASVMVYAPDARPADMQNEMGLSVLAISGIITLASIFFAGGILLLGYVNRDAKRRGMNSALWTWFVLLMLPTSVGIIGMIIYLLVREPLAYPCPRCSNPVGARFNFCPNCKCDLYPSCPNCKREIAETDKFCPYCATELRPASGESTTAQA